MSNALNQLPDRLKAAREACGMTQAEVGRALGVTAASISYLESGARRVDSVQLTKLARLFGREPQDFFEEEFDPTTALQALFRTHLSEEIQPDLLEVGRRCLDLARAESWLEGVLEISQPPARVEGSVGLPVPTRVMQAVEQGEEAAENERGRLGLGSQPLPDMVELLEAQGVRTAILSLPEEVDGLTLAPPRIGPFVVVNCDHGHPRRRFSFAHEYAHVLLDNPSIGMVSGRQNRRDLRETRANSFAAAFLMPERGVRDYVASLGRTSRQGHAEVFDGEESVRFRLRPDSETTKIQPTDIVNLAWHFGVSALAAIYRIKNLGFMTEAERDELIEADRNDLFEDLKDLLDLKETTAGKDEPLAYQHRFLSLVFEALRRKAISWGRADELVRLTDCSEERFQKICQKLNLEPEPTGVILPDLGG